MKNITDLLMPYEEYKKVDQSIPYTYILRSSGGGQCLYYFGSRHFDQANDAQYALLEEFWRKFVAETASLYRVAIIEGGTRTLDTGVVDEKTALERGGEMLWLTFVAKKENVPVETAEIPEEEWFRHMRERFSPEVVAYYDFARVAYQWNRKSQKQPFEDYVEPFLQSNQVKSGWNDFAFSLENLKKVHSTLFKNNFDESDRDFFALLIDPSQHNSPVNDVARYDDEVLRDAYIVKCLEKTWLSGRSMFVLYGSAHAVIQEPALRFLATCNKR